MNSVKLKYKTDTTYVSSANSKAFDTQLLLNVSDKINLERSNKSNDF